MKTMNSSGENTGTIKFRQSSGHFKKAPQYGTPEPAKLNPEPVVVNSELGDSDAPDAADGH